ncbi:MAG: RNA pseudouridine synthase, partial [Vibrio sp.]
AKFGIERLFLHAANIQFVHPASEQKLDIHAPLTANLEQALNQLRQAQSSPEL